MPEKKRMNRRCVVESVKCEFVLTSGRSVALTFDTFALVFAVAVVVEPFAPFTSFFSPFSLPVRNFPTPPTLGSVSGKYK